MTADQTSDEPRPTEVPAEQTPAVPESNEAQTYLGRLEMDYQMRSRHEASTTPLDQRPPASSDTDSDGE